MKRVFAAAGLLVLFSLPVLGGEYLVNDTGQTVYGLQVAFSEPVTIAGFGDALITMSPAGESKTFAFSGGELDAWGGHWITWVPNRATLMRHEWLLCRTGQCIIPSLQYSYALEYSVDFEKDVGIDWKRHQIGDVSPITWRTLQLPWEMPDEELTLVVGPGGIRIEGWSAEGNRTGIQSVAFEANAGFEFACLVRISQAPDSFELESWFGRSLMDSDGDWAVPYARDPHGVVSLLRVTWVSGAWNPYEWYPATGNWTSSGGVDERRTRSNPADRILRLIYDPTTSTLEVFADHQPLTEVALSDRPTEDLEAVVRLSVSSDAGFPGHADVQILGISLGLGRL